METKIIDKTNVNLAIDALKNGECIAFKTDTIFGFSCLASNKEACKKIVEIKQRENKPFIILLGENMEIKKYVKPIPAEIEKIMKHFWPGPLTIIFETTYPFCDEITCKKNTIGIRVPKHELTQQIISALNEPIVSTSVNISGMEFLNNENDIYKVFKGKIPYILTDNSKNTECSSTIISYANNQLNILREGTIKKEDILNILNS